MAHIGCLPGSNLGSSFQHKPLPDTTKWTRLLKIQPYLINNSISCILEHFEKKSCPAYVALSYEWGDPTPRHCIYVNGRSRQIHTNLWRFLCWAWKKHSGQYFWTDSLCLDQTDRGELNEQVARMGETYSRASSVTIWLGDNVDMVEALENWPTTSSSCDDAGMRCMRHLISNSYWGRVVSNATTPTLRRAPVTNLSPPPHLPTSPQADQLSHRPQWITQEVAHARRALVVCGTATADFDALAQSVRHAWSRSRYGRLDLALLRFLALADARRRLHSRDALSFWDLVRAFAQSESTLAVDAVYGLVGLARALCPAFRPHVLGVDYGKSPEDVLWDVLWEPQPRWAGGLLQVSFALLQHRLLPAGGSRGRRFREVEARLREYMARQTTSARHRSQAGVALRALWGFCVLRTHVRRQGAQHDTLLGLNEGALRYAQRQIPQPSFLHHAMALGVALGDDHHCEEDSPWLCAAHHDLYVMRAVGEAAGELQEQRLDAQHRKWTSARDVARALCCKSSDRCSPSYMALCIPSADLSVQWTPEEYFHGRQLRIDTDLSWTFTSLHRGMAETLSKAAVWQENLERVCNAFMHLKTSTNQGQWLHGTEQVLVETME